MRYATIAALSVASVAALAACGIETPAEPGAQPNASTSSSTPADTPTESSSTPADSPSAIPTTSTPTEPPSPSKPSTSKPAQPTGSPTSDCPDTITTIRSGFRGVEWGKGPAKVTFTPVSATICQYDAAAEGDDYATVRTKRTAAASQQLLSLINQAEPPAKQPTICTKELGPTYVLKFADKSQTLMTWVVEAYGCRRMAVASGRGDNPPVQAAPRQATPALIKSLGLR